MTQKTPSGRLCGSCRKRKPYSSFWVGTANERECVGSKRRCFECRAGGPVAPDPIERACVVCGDRFMGAGSRALACSEACRLERFRAMARRWAARNKKRRSDPVAGSAHARRLKNAKIRREKRRSRAVSRAGGRKAQ